MKGWLVRTLPRSYESSFLFRFASFYFWRNCAIVPALVPMFEGCERCVSFQALRGVVGENVGGHALIYLKSKRQRG